jgi:Family of unknown function (DUF5395)
MRIVDVELRYEHHRWRARGDGIDVVHTELRGLEALLRARLAHAQTPLGVQLRFDAGALPRWIDQYHGHYRSYVLHVPPRGGA